MYQSPSLLHHVKKKHTGVQRELGTETRRPKLLFLFAPCTHLLYMSQQWRRRLVRSESENYFIFFSLSKEALFFKIYLFLKIRVKGVSGIFIYIITIQFSHITITKCTVFAPVYFHSVVSHWQECFWMLLHHQLSCDWYLKLIFKTNCRMKEYDWLWTFAHSLGLLNNKSRSDWWLSFIQSFFKKIVNYR